jgi:arsenate reductase
LNVDRGEIVAELDHDKAGYLVAEIDPKRVVEARKRLPAWHTNSPFTLHPVIKASVHPNQPAQSSCPPAMTPPRMSRGITGVNTEVTATTRKPHLTVYHNPTCSKCKEVLAILSDKSSMANYSVIDYMQHQFSRDELYHIIDLLQLDDSNVQELIRPGAEAEEVSTVEEAVNVLTHQPQLIQRPIVIDEERRKAQICRPPALIMQLLDPNHA